ncbi:MAG TPA: hypothetical protein VHF45_01205 [Thermoleophilaceae bacterium]|jgi:hypothetical protein|nr:hypothetical protein [Thermoleophilaceae bacterium]
MVRFAAALAVLAALAVVSLVWAADMPSDAPQRPAKTVPFAKGSVTTRAIRDDTIRLRDLHGSVRRLARRPGPPGRDGEDGLDGLDGQDGLDGEDGEDGVSAYEVVRGAAPVTEAVGSHQVECPAGKVVLGGGAIPTSDEPGAAFQVEVSGLQDDNGGWQARARRVAGAGPWTLSVQAICADVNP